MLMRVGDQVTFGAEGNTFLGIATIIGWFTICLIQIVGLLSGDKSPMQVKLKSLDLKLLIKKWKPILPFSGRTLCTMWIFLLHWIWCENVCIFDRFVYLWWTWTNERSCCYGNHHIHGLPCRFSFWRNETYQEWLMNEIQWWCTCFANLQTCELSHLFKLL